MIDSATSFAKAYRSGRAIFRSFLPRIISKLISYKPTAVIRTESFDVRFVLSLSTKGKCPANLERLGLSSETLVALV